MPNRKIFILSSLCLLCISACGKLKSSGRSEVFVTNTSTDANLTKSRKAAFGPDDVKAVTLLPKEASFEPWSSGAFQLVGTFPDGSQGLITDDVTWSISSSSPNSIVLDSATGVFASSLESSETITATWRKLNSKGKIAFTYAKDSINKSLNNPAVFTATIVSAGKIKLSWSTAQKGITGMALAYSKVSVPDACVAGVAPLVTTVYIGPDILDAEKHDHEISGLDQGSTYYFKLCTVQKIELGGNKIERLSSGSNKTVTLPPI